MWDILQSIRKSIFPWSIQHLKHPFFQKWNQWEKSWGCGKCHINTHPLNTLATPHKIVEKPFDSSWELRFLQSFNLFVLYTYETRSLDSNKLSSSTSQSNWSCACICKNRHHIIESIVYHWWKILCVYIFFSLCYSTDI